MKSPDEVPGGALARHRTLYLVLGAGVLATAAGAAVYLQAEDPPTCDARADVIAQTWNAEAERKMTVAFAGTGVPMAGAVGPKAAAALGTYAQDWSQAWRTACTAQGHSADVEVALDRGFACLEGKRGQFAALLDVFRDADAVVVEYAIDAVWGLPAAEACSDLVGSMDASAGPELALLRGNIQHARALTMAGRGVEADVLAADAVTRAREIGDPAGVWEALVLQAQTALANNDHRLARAAALEAHTAALAAGQTDVAMESALTAVSVEPNADNSSETLDVVAKIEELAGGRRKELMPAIHQARGRVHAVMGDDEAAKQEFELALAAATNPRARAAALRSLASTGGGAEGGDELALRQRVVTEVGYAYGDVHWRLAEAKEELAAAYLNEGLAEPAIMLLDDALKSYETSLGPNSHRLVGAFAKLADVAVATGDAEGAVELYRRALEVGDRAKDVDPELRVSILRELAGQLARQGDASRALQTHEQAVSVAVEQLPAQSTLTANARLGLAGALLSAGRRPEAMQQLGLGLHVLAKVAAGETEDVVLSALNLAVLHVEEEQPGEALDALAVAEDLVGRIHKEENIEHAYLAHVRGTIFALSKDYTAAAAAFTTCIEIAKRVAPPGDVVHLNCRLELAQARYDAGEPTGTALTEALELVARNELAPPSIAARVLILAAAAEPKRAASHLAAARAVVEKMDPSDERVEPLLAKIAAIEGR